jgi:hypothetical protein
MDFLEKDLEDIIFISKNEDLRKRGLDIDGIKKRQVSIGNYGRADLISRSTVKDDEFTLIDVIEGKRSFEMYKEYNHYITVYELKQNTIDIRSFLQAIGYCKGIYDYLMLRKIYNFRLNICLIGKSINLNNEFKYLPIILTNDLFHLSLYTYSYEIDGIHFELYRIN